MTPTPREPREVWPHRPTGEYTDGFPVLCDYDGIRWPCPSQQYLDAIVAEVREYVAANDDCPDEPPETPRSEGMSGEDWIAVIKATGERYQAQVERFRVADAALRAILRDDRQKP